MPGAALSETSSLSSLVTGGVLGSDIVFSNAEFSSGTTDHGYVVTITSKCHLIYIYKDLATSAYSGILKVDDQPQCAGKNQCKCFITGSATSNFGAGWNFGGQIYFAHNDANLGVHNVRLSYDQSGKVNGYDLVQVSTSAGTSLNDGANCPDVEDPFPTCGDPDGVLGDDPSITKDQCGTGYRLKPDSDNEACSGEVDNPNGNTPATVPGCDVGSASAKDTVPEGRSCS